MCMLNILGTLVVCLFSLPAFASETRLYVPAGLEYGHSSFTQSGTSTSYGHSNNFSATSGLVFLSKYDIGAEVAISLGKPDADNTNFYYRSEANLVYAPAEFLYVFAGVAGSTFFTTTYHDYFGLGTNFGAAFLFHQFRLKAGWEHSAEDFLGISKKYRSYENTYFVSLSYLFSVLRSAE